MQTTQLINIKPGQCIRFPGYSEIYTVFEIDDDWHSSSWKKVTCSRAAGYRSGYASVWRVRSNLEVEIVQPPGIQLIGFLKEGAALDPARENTDRLC